MDIALFLVCLVIFAITYVSTNRVLFYFREDRIKRCSEKQAQKKEKRAFALFLIFIWVPIMMISMHFPGIFYGFILGMIAPLLRETLSDTYHLS